MALILEIVEGIHRFLSYLNISSKYLNRAYTILSVIPTLYILRIVYGLAKNGNYIRFILYLLLFLVLVYFIVLNVFYYFFDKSSKFDVTKYFVKYLPDEVFDADGQSVASNATLDKIHTQEVAVHYIADYRLTLASCIQALIDNGDIKTNDLTKRDGFYISKNTLFPYYYAKKISETEYVLQIGTSYTDLKEIGRITWSRSAGELKLVGLFIQGGDFAKQGVRYHEPYQLKLLAKREQAETLDRSNTSKAAAAPSRVEAHHGGKRSRHSTR